MSRCTHIHTGIWAIHLMNVTTATLHVKCHTTSPPTKEEKETKKKKRTEKTTPLGVQYREALDDPELGQSFCCLPQSWKAVFLLRKAVNSRHEWHKPM